VYAGIDPLARRAIRLKTTAKTEQQARIELGRLLKDASEGRTPETGAILAPGDELPSITEVSALQGIGTGVIRHALEALAADGLIIVRHGRAAGSPSTRTPAH
jgi:Bacterial regulatory proteins, gntR family